MSSSKSEAGHVTTKRSSPKAGRRTRAEKTEETRRRLLRAAADIIGEDGYAKATIAKITARADLALGTFYSYFDNRDQLFDELLPRMGDEMIAYIRDRLEGVNSLLAQEELGIRAFFDFILDNPGFYRLLNEAETMAPNAYRKHFDNVTRKYVRALQHRRAAGELGGYTEEELEIVVFMLMSARNYLTMRYARSKAVDRQTIERVIQTYMKFVSGGLVFGSEGGSLGSGHPVERGATKRRTA